MARLACQALIKRCLTSLGLWHGKWADEQAHSVLFHCIFVLQPMHASPRQQCNLNGTVMRQCLVNAQGFDVHEGRCVIISGEGHSQRVAGAIPASASASVRGCSGVPFSLPARGSRRHLCAVIRSASCKSTLLPWAGDGFEPMSLRTSRVKMRLKWEEGECQVLPCLHNNSLPAFPEMYLLLHSISSCRL